MKAATYTAYGPPEVVTVTDVPKPSPGPTQVLVKVHASTVSSADWRARSLAMPKGFGLMGRPAFGLFGPRQKVLGSDLSGVVAEVGADVTAYKPGDAIFGSTGMTFGAHAEFVVLEETGLIAPKPENLTFGEAAAIPFGGMTALDFLHHKAGLGAGEKVLIHSASGCVGTAALQVAKNHGAHVTGMTSAGNIALVLGLGADATIDYRERDIRSLTGHFDVILDTTGTIGYSDVRHIMGPDARLLLILASLWQNIGFGRAPKGSGHRVIAGIAKERPQDIATLGEMAQNGQFTPVIDRSYALADIRKAHAHVETGHKVGNVVVSMV